MIFKPTDKDKKKDPNSLDAMLDAIIEREKEELQKKAEAEDTEDSDAKRKEQLREAVGKDKPILPKGIGQRKASWETK